MYLAFGGSEESQLPCSENSKTALSGLHSET
jgi:hypothetical protein